MRFDVMGHPSDFPAIAEFHNQQDERKCEIGCCGCDRNGHAHHSTSPSASAGRVFSTAVTGAVEFSYAIVYLLLPVAVVLHWWVRWLVGVAGGVCGVIALFQTGKANQLAKDANELAESRTVKPGRPTNSLKTRTR